MNPSINHLSACRNVFEAHYVKCRACQFEQDYKVGNCIIGAAALDEYVLALQKAILHKFNPDSGAIFSRRRAD